MKNSSDIAVIGLSSLFPGSKTVDEYWQTLVNGENHIREIPSSRWENDEYYSPTITAGNKMISKWAGLLDDITSFDHKFFGLLPEEANCMDPQSRLMLQEVWHCLEDAAVTPNYLNNFKTSVYIGAFALDYLQLMARAPIVATYACHGNYPCMIANRISHFLNLSGESFSIDAACASSLIALHEAKIALRNGICDYAIVGAANIICHPWQHIAFSKCRMFSPDGQCKTFDRSANGYVRGEGVGALLLTTKKLAIKNHHRIYAIVKGSAVNHCGNTRTISTPSFHAQRKVIREAIHDALVSPQNIAYIEAHGTGTALGDAIECHALNEVFSQKRKLYLGSVKTNIGHLEAAAGMAGVIKVIMMLKHKMIPKHLNFSNPNPIIDFDNSPLTVPTKNIPWKSSRAPLLAGVSSFGFGGTNAHVIIEEYKKPKTSTKHLHSLTLKKDKILTCHPLLFSARSQEELTNYLNKCSLVTANHDIKIKDISYTLLKGRHFFAKRAAYLSNDAQNFSSPLSSNCSPGNKLGFRFGKLSKKTFTTLQPFMNAFLTPQEIEFLETGLSEEASGGYIIGKLLLNLGFTPQIVLGENESNIVAHELFKSQKSRGYYLDQLTQKVITSNPISFDQYQSMITQLNAINQIDQLLLNRIKELFEFQYSLRKILSDLNQHLQPYCTSVLPLENLAPSSEHSAKINFILLMALKAFYKKYELPIQVSSSNPILEEINNLVSEGIIPLTKALSILHNSAEINDLFPQDMQPEELVKDCFMINIGACSDLANNNLGYQDHDDPWKELLELLITYWLSGKNINWDKFADYFYTDASLISLPGYCFEKTSSWCK